ncbi:MULTISPECIES: carbohydrate kinase family protein [Nesterenkonia]|uniref:Fructokinase n=1 Tax=Nesterenkonia xinjiangensis TaxID=225327 RepID=A0A7Z0K9T1_9MICC|nr:MULTISPECIES: carbohydrate kinase [Nesterenkonia]MDZ5078294.1 carbohydrate kinase [Nesterenkonia sp. HG001]NYJ78093.1 fructokinase [Nesterenkonia xinjiangensis]
MSAYLAVIGECLVDVVHSETSAPKAHVGGSPFNVAVGLARLEHDVVFAGRHGEDEYGRMIARSLRAQGITALLDADASPTSVAKAVLDPAGQASYEFTLDWTLPPAAALEKSFCALVQETRAEESPALDLLHTGSIGAMMQPGAETVKGLLHRARDVATISYDPNYRPSIIPNREEARDQAEEFISLADVVQASTDDIDLLYPERTHEDTMRAWLELGPGVVIITRGSSGAMGLARSGFVDQPAFSIEVADTVGAGDSFMAATLSTLRGLGLLGAARREALQDITASQLTDVLSTAARAAAITSSRFGAQPPTAAELGAALEEGAEPA